MTRAREKPVDGHKSPVHGKIPVPEGEAAPAPPAKTRRANKRRAADIQQLLPLADDVSPSVPLLPQAVASATRRLWFCVYLPNLPLESCGAGKEPLAVLEDQQGIHRVQLANTAAESAGVMPGQSANAALALIPTLQL